MATNSSILAWEILWTEEPGGLQSSGHKRVGHNLATNSNNWCITLCEFQRCNTVIQLIFCFCSWRELLRSTLLVTFKYAMQVFLFHRFYPHLDTTSDGLAENKLRLLKICCCNRVSLRWEPEDLDFWLYLAMDKLCDLGQMSFLLWVFFRNKDGVRQDDAECPSSSQMPQSVLLH